MNVMIHEARFEAELLYGLKAIYDYCNQMWVGGGGGRDWRGD